MRPFFLTGVLLSVLFCGTPADACSCMESGPPCQGYFQVDAVFAGTVREITDLERTADPLRFNARRVALTVDRAFRGVEGTSVAVFTGLGGGDCGYSFKNGERYLVYAYRAQDGRLTTGICSRTRPLAQAVDDLQFIESLATAKPGARISGAITHWERDLAGVKEHRQEPMPFVHVQVSGPSGGGQAATDEKGRYEFTGLPAGKYRVEVFPPPNFSTVGLERDVELRDARSCAVANFGVHFDGQISGVVRGRSGDPVGGAVIQLLASSRPESQRMAEMLTATTDASGFYRLTDVPPGQYVIGIALQRTMEREEVPVYPRPSTPAFPPPLAPRSSRLARVRALRSIRSKSRRRVGGVSSKASSSGPTAARWRARSSH